MGVSTGPWEPVQVRSQTLEEAHRLSREGGGTERIAKQHARGKLTAYERVTALLDPGSLETVDDLATHTCEHFGMSKTRPPGDGVLTGSGTVFGRRVYVYSQDFTVFGGSLGYRHAQKIVKVMREALKVGAPIVGIHDSGGARIQEGVAALAGYAEVFQANIDASGVVPQLAIVAGPCAGGAVYSPALMDFTLMTRGTGCMFLTGPDVVESVTGERVTMQELGGADVHCGMSGVASNAYGNDLETLAATRELLALLPANNEQGAPSIKMYDPVDRPCRSLSHIVPKRNDQVYDMLSVVRDIVDNGEVTEMSSEYAANIITAFTRIDGKTVGVIANQPTVLAGVLDSDASCKAARFVNFCDAFRIPLLTLVDVPGFLPGTAQEKGGIIRHGAKLMHAYGAATVPKVTLITRKAYGGAYCVMSSKHLNGDVNLAWPSAEVAVMGADGATKVIFRGRDPSTMEKEIKEYTDTFYNPLIAAQHGYLDRVIQPADSRKDIAGAFKRLRTKRVVQVGRRARNFPM